MWCKPHREEGDWQQVARQNARRCRRVVLVGSGTGPLMVPARPHLPLTWRHPAAIATPPSCGPSPERSRGRLRTRPDLVEDLLD